MEHSDSASRGSTGGLSTSVPGPAPTGGQATSAPHPVHRGEVHGMFTRPLPLVIALAVALVPPAAKAQDAMPVKTVAAIKEATTFIRTDVDSDVDGPVMSGS